MSARGLYYRTFARAAILPYAGGTVLHILRLAYRFPVTETPVFIHGVIVLLAGYAGLGFILFIRTIPFRGLWDKVLYALVIIHLGGSALLHAYSLISHSNEWLTLFSFGYSYFAIAYFVLLGAYCAGLSARLRKL